MASVEQCREAITILVQRFESFDHDHRREHVPERTIALTLLDLDLTFRARLSDGQLVDLTTGSGPKTDIRLIMNSDDLLDLTDKRVTFTHAWATGRVRLDASLFDLLRLRRGL